MNLTTIGVGPGDPELITLKGLRKLQEADLIFVPRSRDGSISIAQRIVDAYISDTQIVIALPLPMTRDMSELVPAWIAAAEVMLDAYKTHSATNGVYLILGDPLLYGSFTYIWEQLAILSPELTVEFVPGITALSATASATQTILGTTDDRIVILPASYETDEAMLESLLQQFDTIILMKAGTVLPQLLGALEKLNLLESAVYGERVGMPEEVIVTDVSTLIGQKRPYLSLLIIRNTA